MTRPVLTLIDRSGYLYLAFHTLPALSNRAGEPTRAQFGVRADQGVDYLALVGDSADKLPGVPKCGPKTAAKWLQEHGTLDAVIANADKIGGKTGESLRAALGQLPLSRQLATIKTDVAL